MKRKQIYYKDITERLDKLEVGESFDRKELIEELWGDFNYYLEVSFSTIIIKCRKTLKPKPFKTINKRVCRIT